LRPCQGIQANLPVTARHQRNAEQPEHSTTPACLDILMNDAVPYSERTMKPYVAALLGLAAAFIVGAIFTHDATRVGLLRDHSGAAFL